MPVQNTLTFGIADIYTAVASPDPSLPIRADESTEPFLVQGLEPHLRIEVRPADLSGHPVTGALVFDSGSTWKLYHEGDLYTFRLQSQALGTVPYKMAKVRKDFREAEVLMHPAYLKPGQAVYPLEYPLDELLFIHHLARLTKGMEVHACGVVDSHGKGHLFLGQSGAGKTTLARLWENEPGVLVLSDDRIALRKMDGKLWMYGTPWHGEADFSSPARAPLADVCFLAKGPENRLLEKAATESMGRFLASSFILFYSREAVGFTMRFLEEIVEAVPCYELSFLPDKRVVKWLQTRYTG
jgi:hypothetical protein